MRLYENVQLAFGPTVDNGFYYDLALGHRLTEEDFPKIEEEMKKLIKLDEAFERIELPHPEAVEMLAGMGQTLKSRTHQRWFGGGKDRLVLSAGQF
jgi:threonyl-tRNA synthetase